MKTESIKELHNDIKENKRLFQEAREEAEADAKVRAQEQEKKLEQLRKEQEQELPVDLQASLLRVIEEAKNAELPPEQIKSAELWARLAHKNNGTSDAQPSELKEEAETESTSTDTLRAAMLAAMDAELSPAQIKSIQNWKNFTKGKGKDNIRAPAVEEPKPKNLDNPAPSNSANKWSKFDKRIFSDSGEASEDDKSAGGASSDGKKVFAKRKK